MSDSTHSAPDRIKVACLQTHPRVGDMAANVAASLSAIERAAALGARLIVLPELANSGYVLSSRPAKRPSRWPRRCLPDPPDRPGWRRPRVWA